MTGTWNTPDRDRDEHWWWWRTSDEPDQDAADQRAEAEDERWTA